MGTRQSLVMYEIQQEFCYYIKADCICIIISFEEVNWLRAQTKTVLGSYPHQPPTHQSKHSMHSFSQQKLDEQLLGARR